MPTRSTRHAHEHFCPQHNINDRLLAQRLLHIVILQLPTITSRLRWCRCMEQLCMLVQQCFELLQDCSLFAWVQHGHIATGFEARQ